MDFTKDIYINKDEIYEDEDFVVLYKGYLFLNNLTKDLYLAYGYGKNWDNKSEIKMKPSTFGYLATVNVESTGTLEFCFHDNSGNWDNNNHQNYILPIKESKNVLSFKPIKDSSTVVDIEPETQETVENPKEKLFETEVVNSNSFELYKTVDLENTNKKSIPDNTLIKQINLNNENEKIVSESIIKTETTEEVAKSAFSILEENTNDTVKNFYEKNEEAEQTATTPVQEAPQILENIDEKSLVTTETTTLEKVTSFFGTIATTIKTAFFKVVKLVKTSLNINQEDE